MIAWITIYIVIGFVFLLAVEYSTDWVKEQGFMEDQKPIENFDRWVISLLWPLGLIIAIKGLIQNYFNNKL
tara:strand:+ start:90 stop:302 length:213 start_codon:yes stop_codon:yes gene_type:complete